jgi:hypothetical protein
MKRKRWWVIAAVATVCLLVPTLAFAVPGADAA